MFNTGTQMVKKLVGVFLIIIILLHLAFVLISAFSKPFQGDEVNFIHTTEAIKNNGNPSAFYSLAHPLYEGNSQPLLYYYLLALSTALFGDSLIAWRLVSILFNVGVIFLVYFIALYIFEGKKNKEKWALFAVVLYALNPLAIQSSVILDIDGGILNFFTLLFVFLFVKDAKPIYLIPSLFLVFWSKLTGPTVLFASLFIYIIFTKRKDKIIRAKETAFVFISSLLLFLSTYWFYVAYYQLRFLTLFEHGSVTSNLISFISAPIPFILRSIWSLKSFIYFAVPFFILLFLSLLFVFVKRRYYIKYDKLFFIGIVSFITIFIFFTYGATGFNFPKYYATALSFMSIFSAFMLSKIKFNFEMKRYYLLYIALLIITSLYFFFFLRDPLIPEISSTINMISLKIALFPLIKRFLLYVIIPLIISFIFIYKLKLKNKFFVILILLTFILYLYLGIIQALANYSTHNLYGTSGIEETVGYLKEKNVSGENIATYPDIGYYIGYNRYYDLTFVYNNPDRLKKEILDNPEVLYIIMLEKDFDRIGRENLNNFKQEEKIGDYYILKRELII